MPANSKHPGDILLWLEKVIDSCVTAEQLMNCHTMIGLFQQTYNIDWYNPMHNEVRRLDNKQDQMWWKLIEQRLELKTK